MKKAKKLLSLLLAVIMLYSSMAVGLGGIAIYAASVSLTTDDAHKAVIGVPETIYMAPNGGASQSGQYFVNNIVESSGSVTLAAENAQTQGSIGVYAPGSTAISFNVTAVTSGIGDPVLGGSSSDANSSYESTKWDHATISSAYGTGAAQDWFRFDMLNLYINGTGLTPGKTALIEWAITVYYGANDTTGVTYYAYSVLYSPHRSVGAVSESRRSGTYNNEISSWITGINGIGNGTWSPISSGRGDKTTAGYFKYDPLWTGLQGGSSESSDDYVTASSTELYVEAKGTSGADWTRAIGYLGYITVDSSRYTNTNQIPNFQIGSDALRVNDGKKDSLGRYYAWYILGDASKTIGTGEDATPSGWTQFVSKSEPQATSRNPLVPAPAFDVSSINGLYIHVASQGYCTYLSSKEHSNAYVSAQFTTVNKADLRKLVLEGASLNSKNYTSATWDAYKKALQDAALALGNPSNSSIDTSTLTTKRNELQTTVTLNANGGNIGTTSFNATVGAAATYNYNVASYTPSRTGYTFKGWATSSTATSGSTSTVNAGLMPTLYAVWEANKYNVVFDNLFDFSKFTIGTGALEINERTATGFTVTSTSGTDANTGFSYAIPVTPGKTYVFSADVSIEQAAGDTRGFDMYINTLDANMAGETTATVDTSNGAHKEGNVYISRTGQKGQQSGATDSYIRFTAGASTAYIKVRFDANTEGNKLTVNNIRVYEEGTIDTNAPYTPSVSVTYDGTYSNLPTPTRENYEFLGWYKADGTKLNSTDKVNITDTLYVTSKWKQLGHTITWKDDDGNVLRTDIVQKGQMPSFGSTPTKKATAQFTYTFAGWEPAVTTVTGDATYTAKFNATVNKYKVTWIVDGKTVRVDDVAYGATPSFGADPTKAADAQYTYTFTGWSPAITTVTKDVTYTALFSSTTNEYTVTWVDEDGSTVLDTQTLKYGAKPVYNGNPPTKAADNGYTYTFAGWEPTVSDVTGTATYKATYTATLIPYTITLDAGEGSVSSNTVSYNYESTSVTLPVPTRTGYTFTGWTVKESVGSWSAGAAADGTLSAAYGNVTLVANYSPNQYTVTYDTNGGKLIDINDSAFTATYDGSITYLNEDVSRGGYTFTGWNTQADGSGDTVAVGDVWKYTDITTVYAQWEAIEYTITLINYDSETGEYKVGASSTMTYTIETDINLPCPEVEGHDFKSWSTGISGAYGSWDIRTEYACALGTGNYGNVTLTLNYTPKTYTITWVNHDNSVLETDENVPYGTTPKYDGATPVKESTAVYSYTFSGWTPTVSTVTGDTTYTAEYTQVERTYTIKFVDADGAEISTQTLKYGEAPVVPAEPTKEADAQYTYAFSSWIDANGNTCATIPEVTADATYTADYTATLRNYTITWIVDGKETTTTVSYGGTPEFGSTPTKDADAQYTYSFLGWSTTENGTIAAPAKVTGTATYYAVFGATTNKYDVIWENDDGSTLETDENVEYGTTPKYDGATPTKKADAQYTYTFAGWTPDINIVTGDVTYTAKYDKAVNYYTITFVDEDGITVLEEQTIAYGETPVYGGKTPAKAATAQYTYTFAGWSPKIESVTGDATYIADYTATTNEYTITFVDENGTVLQSSKVAYGATPSYDGETPTKAATAQYTYTFAGWDPEIVAVTGEATYTATFTETVNKYTVTWYNYDGSVIEIDTNVEYGTEPSFDNVTPTRPDADGKIYFFSGWATTQNGEVLNALPTVNGEMNFYAIFVSSDAKFDVEWTDADGNVIETETDTEIAYGTPVNTIAPAIGPEKEADAQYTYEFIGWDTVANSETALDLAEFKVTSATVFYPVYSKTVNEYTITFIDEDGITVLDEQTVAYGSTPVYGGKTPTKAATAQYTYTFAGWDNELVAVTGEATYTATYDATVNKYTIKFVNEDGTELQSSEVEYGTVPSYTGTTPTQAATAQYTYTFAGWDNEPVAVTGEATYTATYNATVNKYIIKFVNEDGTELQSSEVEYGAMPDYTGSTPTKAATAQYTYTFKDWDKAIVAVTGEATYKATYDATVNEYKITFVDEDGTTVLNEQTIAYGETPEYKGETPTKASTAQFDYTFAGWTPEVVSVTGEATYKATYDATVRSYTITWLDDEDNLIDTTTVEYGQTPTHADPTKASTAQYDYTFAGWTPDVVTVTGDATYKATFTSTVRSYEITWLDDEGNEIDTTTVEYGQTPTHADPTKDSTAQFDYTFAGWTPEVATVTGVATYKATYTETVRSYTITWVTGAGEFTGSWEYGSTPDPVADNVDTSKAPTAEKEYIFSGWNKTIATVTGDATYAAQYSEEIRSYTVTYVVNGETLETQTVKFGSNFTHPAIPAIEGYDSHWDVPYMTMPAQDITAVAVYTAKKYTVTWIADEETVYTEQVAFGSAIPSKPVPDKLGNTGVWDNIPDTMPAGEVTITAVYTPNNYSVIWTFTYGSGSALATYGEDFEVTFDVAVLPLDVRITVNGDVLETEYYSYDAETGTLFILGEVIIGAISITEKAAEGYQNVVISAVNATLTNTSAIIAEGTAFHTQILPDEGYLVPKSVVVCIDGVELHNGYTYDSATGKLTINAEVMYGELSIRFECPVNPSYGGGSGNCKCNCHSNSAFVRFFFSIATFFRRIFGMTKYRYCDCGAAHW